jgi:hypothetical protein
MNELVFLIALQFVRAQGGFEMEQLQIEIQNMGFSKLSKKSKLFLNPHHD